ncbi:hypothetical protein CsatB_020280 [Cannabis sativa]
MSFSHLTVNSLSLDLGMVSFVCVISLLESQQGFGETIIANRFWSFVWTHKPFLSFKDWVSRFEPFGVLFQSLNKVWWW